MVITNQQLTLNTQEKTRRESKHKKVRKPQGKRKRKERKTIKNRKQVTSYDKYILINNYVKYKWTKCSKQKIHSGWMNKKKGEPSICCPHEIHFRSKDTQTEFEKIEKDIPCKWKWKES